MGENNRRVGRANPKDRDNWQSSCVRFDCNNRGEKCEECFRFDQYCAPTGACDGKTGVA